MRNKIQDYHISKGADSHFYILNNGGFFVQNLSIDLDKAISKAQEITGKNVPVNIWLRSHRKIFEYVVKPKQQDSHIDSFNRVLSNIQFKKEKAICDARQYLGSVGDAFTDELEMVNSFSFAGEHGVCWCYNFKDKNDNRFIYFGSSSELDIFRNEGDKFVISFQIKKQFINTYKDCIPYKLNQIAKVKNTIINKEKMEFCQLNNYKDLAVGFVNAKKKEDVKFSFYYDGKLFSSKKFKTFKESKEFLYYLKGLLNNSKIQPDDLFINNTIEEAVKSFYKEILDNKSGVVNVSSDALINTN